MGQNNRLRLFPSGVSASSLRHDCLCRGEQRDGTMAQNTKGITSVLFSHSTMSMISEFHEAVIKETDQKRKMGVGGCAEWFIYM